MLAFSLNSFAAEVIPESYDKLNAAFPDFSFTDPMGKQAKISDYKGEVVVVKLWATWCGICRAKWPHHQALYNDVKNINNVRIITLSVFEEPSVSQAWVDQQGYDVPLYKNLITKKGAVKVANAPDYFIKGTPMIFLIDKEGVLRKKVVGIQGQVSKSDIHRLL